MWEKEGLQVWVSFVQVNATSFFTIDSGRLKSFYDLIYLEKQELGLQVR